MPVSDVIRGSNLDASSWCRWESGRHAPSLFTAYEIARLLRISVCQLLDPPDKAPPLIYLPLVSMAQAAGLAEWPAREAVPTHPFRTDWPLFAGLDKSRHCLVEVPNVSGTEASLIPPGTLALVDRAPEARLVSIPLANVPGSRHAQPRRCRAICLLGPSPADAGFAVITVSAVTPAATRIAVTPFRFGHRRMMDFTSRRGIETFVRAIVLMWFGAEGGAEAEKV